VEVTIETTGARAAVEARCARVVAARWFQPAVVTTILANAVVLGLETYEGVMARHGDTLERANHVFLAVFVAELAVRFGAYATRPGAFLRNGWNIFDAACVGASFIPGVAGNAQLLRLARLLRVVRLVSVLPDLRVVLAGLVRSAMPIASMFLLTVFMLYVFGFVGWMLFGRALPSQWGDIDAAMLTLFQVLTLEGWNGIAGEAAAATSGWAWVYFIVFVLLATFVVFNLVVGIMVNSLEEARERHRGDLEAERRRRAPAHTREELEQTLDAMRRSLRVLEAHVQRMDAHPPEAAAARPPDPAGDAAAGGPRAG
jgi:voltage-gated sodium channel